MKNTTADCQKRLVKAVIQLYYVFLGFFSQKATDKSPVHIGSHQTDNDNEENTEILNNLTFTDSATAISVSHPVMSLHLSWLSGDCPTKTYMVDQALRQLVFVETS